MKKGFLSLAALLICAQSFSTSINTESTVVLTPRTEKFIQLPSSYSDEDFEKAVEIIKKYETIHPVSRWPYVGYGHLVKKGEKIPRRQMSEKEADALLRKDLREYTELFEDYGKDQLLLGVLAYSVGPYRLLGAQKMKKSRLLDKLESGNRDIKNENLSYSRFKGRRHNGLLSRRHEEYSALFRK